MVHTNYQMVTKYVGIKLGYRKFDTRQFDTPNSIQIKMYFNGGMVHCI